MGGLSGPRTAGHTGFTGTDVVIDPASRSFAILLTNRVHPSRNWGSINIARETLCTGLAKALAVRPERGRDAWYTGIGDASQATLTTVALQPEGPVRVNFDAFVDSESTDFLVLEASTDGTSWTRRSDDRLGARRTGQNGQFAVRIGPSELVAGRGTPTARCGDHAALAVHY